MRVTGTSHFRGPRPLVWELLQDPEVWSKAFSGAQRLVRTGDNRYEGTMKVGFGFLKADFALILSLGNKVAPERFTIDIDGSGPFGFARGTAAVDLRDAEDGGTFMEYASDLQIGGRVASVGQGVIDTAATSMAEKGLEALRREVDERIAARGGENT